MAGTNTEDMKAAMEYLVSLVNKEPHFKEYKGMLFCDKQMNEIKAHTTPYAPPAPEGFTTNTLSGLVTMLKAKECADWPMIYVHVRGPREVFALTTPREDFKRAALFSAKQDVPEIIYGRFIDREEMIIMLRSKFVQTEDCTTLISLIGKVKEDNTRETNDDGISQSVIAKAGIAVVGTIPVKPIQSLKPYRTFMEVDQPASEFLFRIKEGDMGIFEADGGLWRNTATTNIAAYLEEELAGIPNITIVQ